MHILSTQELEINEKKIWHLKCLLLLTITKVINPFFLICQEGGNVLQTVVYS